MERAAIREKLKQLRKPYFFGVAVGFTAEMLIGESLDKRTVEEIVEFEAVAVGTGSFSLATMYAAQGMEIGKSATNGAQYGIGVISGQFAAYCIREGIKYYWR